MTLLDHERVVTLTGSGGVGKSRLAQAVASEHARRRAVRWVELAPVADGGAVATTALAALRVGQAPDADPAVQVARALRDGSLLVLDNCEHLIDDCAAFVAILLGANPHLSVLTTSREPLAVPGEVTWRVPSLDETDAVRLFDDRARRANRSLVMTEDNAPAVAEICRRLDGIPLAIELAAARCRQLTIEHIRLELRNRFRLLSGGARTVPARQQTLAASIAWSHDRLGDVERRAFRRLGVFAGPFPLGAAEALIGAAADIQPDDMLDLMGRLVDRSLVVADDGAHGELRYRLLETLRAYAVERASEAGELPALREAHANWWAGWLAERDATLHTDAVLESVEEFHDNLKAALDWATEEDPALGLRLLERLARSWENLGRDLDAVSAIERLLTPGNADRYGHEWIAAANAASHIVATTRGDTEWIPFTETVEGTAAQLGDRYHELRASLSSDPTSQEEVLALARVRGDHYVAGRLAIERAKEVAIGDPREQLVDIEQLPTATESPVLRDLAIRSRAFVARDVGDLRHCLTLATELSGSRSTQMVQSAVGLLGVVGRLAVDVDALELASQVARGSWAR